MDKRFRRMSKKMWKGNNWW